MAILALEPDSARAATIRHIVRDIVRADLTLVTSKKGFLQALEAGIPELILLPALLSPVDETELLKHLSALQDSGHVELLVTPFSFAPEAAPVAPSGWRRWLKKKSDPQFHGSDPRAFAEQMLWSLRRGQEERDAHTDRRELQRELAAATIVESQSPIHLRSADRRAHIRFPADELQGLRGARIKHGPRVRLVDCSTGGALLESEVPLRPDSEALLELAGEAGDSIVPFRVVRCHVAAGESRLLYWGACVFTKPLELAHLLQARSSDITTSTIDRTDRLDIAVKAIVNRHVSRSDGKAVPELIASLQGLNGSRPDDPVSQAIDDLLKVVIAALQNGDERAVTTTLIEKQLRVALPLMTSRFAAAPASITTAGHEVFYLRVPSADGAASRVLNVELPHGSALEDWQFRLLEASAYLAALAGTTNGRERRRYVRVSGRFDGRRLGAISTPILIHDLSVAGCFVDSLTEEREGRHLTLELHLPDEGVITLEAEIVCSRPGFGFAVRFIDVSEKNHACLARVIATRTGSLMDSHGSIDLAQSMIA